MGAERRRGGSFAGNALPKTCVGPFGSLDEKEGFSVALGKRERKKGSRCILK